MSATLDFTFNHNATTMMHPYGDTQALQMTVSKEYDLSPCKGLELSVLNLIVVTRYTTRSPGP